MDSKKKVRAQVTPLFSAAETSERRRAKSWLESRIVRGQGDVFSEAALLSPELAELLMQRNDDNRQVKPSVVSTIKRDILEGRWELNGEPIIVSTCGKLNDGQHRCMAVIDSGRTVQAFFTFGLTRGSRSTIDTGTARTPGDLVSMRGLESGNTVAAVAGYLWQIDNYGEIPQAAHAPNVRPTKAQMLDVVDRRMSEIQTSMAAVPKSGSSRIASHSILCVAHILLSRVASRDDAAAYIASLVKGEKLDGRDPIFVARERMMEEKRKRAMWPHKAIEIVLRGWNLHRRGKAVGKIQIMAAWPKVER